MPKRRFLRREARLLRTEAKEKQLVISLHVKDIASSWVRARLAIAQGLAGRAAAKADYVACVRAIAASYRIASA